MMDIIVCAGANLFRTISQAQRKQVREKLLKEL